MKKFLRLWLKHPLSVTGMIIAFVLAVQTRSFYPIVLLIIPCGFFMLSGNWRFFLISWKKVSGEGLAAILKS